MNRPMIRYAKKTDFAKLNKMSREAWPTWWKENPGYGSRYVRNRIVNKRTIIAVIDGKIVAYLVFGSEWSRHWHLEDVYVDSKYRKQNIGTLLMNEFVKIAKKNGIKKIISQVEPKNKISYKYHIKNKFRKSGHMKKLWGNTDAIVFMRELR